MRSDALIGDIRSRRSIFAGQLAPTLLPAAHCPVAGVDLS
jgi:hypothetical protein